VSRAPASRPCARSTGAARRCTTTSDGRALAPAQLRRRGTSGPATAARPAGPTTCPAWTNSSRSPSAGCSSEAPSSRRTGSCATLRARRSPASSGQVASHRGRCAGACTHHLPVHPLRAHCQPTGPTVLEWLKSPAARHSPSTLTETIDKVRILKKLGTPNLEDAIPLARQAACARAIANRPPPNRAGARTARKHWRSSAFCG